MDTLINEKIKVVSLFENGQVKPILFKWGNRIYRVVEVVFSYSKKIGRQEIFYFSVQTEGGNFEISFNLEKFNWEIEKVF